MTGRNGNEPFAQVPESVIESGLDDACVRLYTYIAQHSGPKGQQWDVEGASEIAKRINMQTKTLMTHAKHLAECGLVLHNREGLKKIEFHLIHCPPKDLINVDVKIPPPAPRFRKTSNPPVPRKTNVVSSDNRPCERIDPVSASDGQSKYAKEYQGIEEAFEWQDWRSDYYHEGPKCAFSGCDEFVRGHTFSSHEPVVSELDVNEPITGDDINKLILAAFPGAQLVVENNLS